MVSRLWVWMRSLVERVWGFGWVLGCSTTGCLVSDREQLNGLGRNNQGGWGKTRPVYWLKRKFLEGPRRKRNSQLHQNWWQVIGNWLLTLDHSCPQKSNLSGVVGQKPCGQELRRKQRCKVKTVNSLWESFTITHSMGNTGWQQGIKISVVLFCFLSWGEIT